MMQVAFGPAASTAVFAGLLASNGLPVSDLADLPAPDCLVATIEGHVAGAVGLQIFGPYALLRSLVVADDQRGHGLGGELVERIESRARERKVERMFLLTTTAEAFFARLGYASADRQSAPEAIRSTQEFSSLCPASSAFMHKDLH
ncbi:arsenic resistance N-acetyltransferase ArsN2 [Pseudoxanthomonas sp. UTMC 1351]|uniref:arsenic resistance N-acetyltransferase ArsN2 n=1 Tax=Pseudoxanthomonas sp. UTMC 1351 TaxID=2695853 RepID=UPI0034CD954F